MAAWEALVQSQLSRCGNVPSTMPGQPVCRGMWQVSVCPPSWAVPGVLLWSPTGSARPLPPGAALAQQRGRAAHAAPALPPKCLQLSPAPPCASPAAPHSVSVSSPWVCGPGPRRAWQWRHGVPLALFRVTRIPMPLRPLAFPTPTLLAPAS